MCSAFRLLFVLVHLKCIIIFRNSAPVPSAATPTEAAAEAQVELEGKCSDKNFKYFQNIIKI